MASFAPNLPDTQAPEWLRYSKEISQPQSDHSFEYAAKGIEGVGEGLLEADKIATSYIKNTAAEGAGKILEDESNKVDSLLPDSSQPAELRAQAFDKASMINEAARANGAISKTHFLATLDRYAKDESANYSYAPHLQEAVRQGIAQATGVSHTANELYESRMKDLNSFLTNKDKANDKVYNELWTLKGAPGWRDAERDMRNKEPGATDKALDLIQKESSLTYRMKVDNEIMNNDKNTEEYRQRYAESSFRTMMASRVGDHLHDVLNESGLTPAGIIDAFRADAEGRKMMSTTQKEQYVQALTAHRTAVAAELTSFGNRVYVDPVTAKPRGNWAGVLGGKFKGMVEEGMSPYDIGISWVKDDKVGPLGAVARWNKAYNDDIERGINTSSLGAPLATMDLIKRKAPDFANKLIGSQFGQGLSDSISGMVGSVKARSVLDTEDLRQASLPPKSAGLMQDFQDLKKAHVRDPKVFNDLVAHIDSISAPDSGLNDKQRAALAYHTYNPSNLGLIKTWAAEGRPGIYEALASDANSKKIKELDGQFPGLYDHYKSWGTETFKTIAQKSILDLNQFQKQDGDLLHYNDQTQQFKYDRISTPYGQKPKNSLVDRTVGDLNRSIRVIANIARAENPDPAHVNAYVYETLRSFGYDEANAPEGFNKDLLGAMRTTASEAQKRRDEIVKSTKKTP